MNSLDISLEDKSLNEPGFVFKNSLSASFFRKRNLHGVRRSDLEALQGIFRRPRLDLAFKFHERDVGFSRHKTNFYETRKSEKLKQSEKKKKEKKRRKATKHVIQI